LQNQEPILQTRGLSVYYDTKKAVTDVDLDVARNRITAIIGPSGCGKSTLLRCFNRMNDLIPSARVEGQVLFDGLDLYGHDVDPTEIRYEIGMVFQRPNPFPKSIYDNVAFGPRINGFDGSIDEVVEKSLVRAALWDEVKDRLKASALSLSGGQQQRLCIARALAVEPRVILMDEPCSALDPIAALVRGLFDHHRDPQHATGGPRFPLHRVLDGGRGEGGLLGGIWREPPDIYQP